jgi:hypothetical protein
MAHRLIHEAGVSLMRGKQRLYFLPDLFIVRTSLRQKGSPLTWTKLACGLEEFLNPLPTF